MADDAKLLYYDADGNQVSEGDASAKRQYRSDDPLRPDATAKERATVESPIVTPEPEEKSQDAPSETKARKSSDNK